MRSCSHFHLFVKGCQKQNDGSETLDQKKSKNYHTNASIMRKDRRLSVPTRFKVVVKDLPRTHNSSLLHQARNDAFLQQKK